MYTEIENHGFYKVYTHDKTRLDLITQLSGLLPHGSGINGNWAITSYKYNGDIYFKASNTFEAMNENGYYCHYYDFTAKYLYHEKTDKPCSYCNGNGYRLLSEMSKYHPEKSTSDLISWLENKGIQIIDDHTILLFVCNVCQGKSTLFQPNFELQEVKVRGRQYICCGYELDDFLYQTLDLSYIQEHTNHE